MEVSIYNISIPLLDTDFNMSVTSMSFDSDLDFIEWLLSDRKSLDPNDPDGEYTVQKYYGTRNDVPISGIVHCNKYGGSVVHPHYGPAPSRFEIAGPLQTRPSEYLTWAAYLDIYRHIGEYPYIIMSYGLMKVCHTAAELVAETTSGREVFIMVNGSIVIEDCYCGGYYYYLIGDWHSPIAQSIFKVISADVPDDRILIQGEVGNNGT